MNILSYYFYISSLLFLAMFDFLSGMPDTRLSCTSGEISDHNYGQAGRFSHLLNCGEQWSFGDRSGIFPAQAPLCQKIWILVRAHSCECFFAILSLLLSLYNLLLSEFYHNENFSNGAINTIAQEN